MILNSSEIKAIEQKEFKLRKNSFSLMQSAGEKCADYLSNNVSKNKLAYKHTMQNVLFFLELYLDLYVFDKKNSDDSFAIKYQFYKISEKL